MSDNPRYLTKSRFKIAQECPTKLYYTGKTAYGNKKDGDDFLKALARGGFQVGELAKFYFKEGIEVRTLDYDDAISQTNNLLSKDKVVIFEAAFRYEQFFIRADVIEKNGDKINLYEVKSKSYDVADGDFFLKTKNELSAKWEKYIFDVAFQTFVIQKALPKSFVSASLFLVNKNGQAAVDQLNQNFILLVDQAKRSTVKVKRILSPKEFGEDLMIKVPVDDPVRFILSKEHQGKKFEQWVQDLATHYKKDDKVQNSISSDCRSCEFRIGQEEKINGLKSGFDECWSNVINLNIDKPLVIDLWNYRGADKLIASKKFLLTDITKEDIGKDKKKEKDGLSAKERQWLQVEKVLRSDNRPYLDIERISAEMKKWVYPLHFIDFETTMTAIPFNKGRRPYEQIAFQFSHHIVQKDGTVEHAGEYINRERGKFPNFDFVRILKSQLEKDSGTILRFSPYENTVLRQIHTQLQSSSLPEGEIKELQKFIETITEKKEGDETSEAYEGVRNMVDMWELVKRYYYHPLTGGSNSIKHVLPATLQESLYLQQKYSKANYGSADGIKSLNFKNHQWIHLNPNGKVEDPYKHLEPIISKEEDLKMERFCEREDIANGGAAMMAYALTQFTEMTDYEAEKIYQALLRYCELDTFAMVLIFEYWKNSIDSAAQRDVA